MWNLASLQEYQYNYYTTVSNLSRFYHQIPISYHHDSFVSFRVLPVHFLAIYKLTCMMYIYIYLFIHLFIYFICLYLYIHIHTSILTSLPPPPTKHSPHRLGHFWKKRCMTFIFGVNWHGISNNPILCRCWELLNHVSWWNFMSLGQVGEKWHW